MGGGVGAGLPGSGQALREAARAFESDAGVANAAGRGC
jgi:hypothetical protein